MKKNSNVLLYQAIVDDLQRKIDDGFFTVGTQIPTEMQLCAEYDVSRITVRRAIEELVKLKRLTIVRGKGTFVRHFTEKKLELFDISGFSDSVKGQESYKKLILQQREVEADAELAKIFSLPIGSPIYL
ncbi:MAG: GntR family transcriptional regulator, partial [Eubacteriales bacterium]|nr:GntR family transcriptional regulator [Eubacteriales bacterium]